MIFEDKCCFENFIATKAPISDEQTSDILGISCVIVNDLKRRRQKDYDFNWESALQVGLQQFQS